ncbi:hypothetical protein Tco_1220883 [Tanacetum coccineum]
MDWNRPPKEGDGAWHIRIELIGLDGLNPILTQLSSINSDMSSSNTSNIKKAFNPNTIIVVEVEPLVKDFASRWKAAIELMHGLQLRG